jgi:hypothetical protein
MKLFFLTIFLCATSYSYAQINRAFASNHEPKVAISPVFQNQKFSAFGLDSIAKPPGLRMKKTGVGLTLGGPLVIIAGIILVTSANSLDAYSTQDDIGIVLRQFGGTIFIIGGTGMTITGIVLWSNGGKKHKSYLENQGATTTLQWKGRVLSLTYHF